MRLLSWGFVWIAGILLWGIILAALTDTAYRRFYRGAGVHAPIGGLELSTSELSELALSAKRGDANALESILVSVLYSEGAGENLERYIQLSHDLKSEAISGQVLQLLASQRRCATPYARQHLAKLAPNFEPVQLCSSAVEIELDSFAMRLYRSP